MARQYWGDEMKEAETDGAFSSYGWIRKAHEIVGVEHT